MVLTTTFYTSQSIQRAHDNDGVPCNLQRYSAGGEVICKARQAILSWGCQAAARQLELRCPTDALSVALPLKQQQKQQRGRSKIACRRCTEVA